MWLDAVQVWEVKCADLSLSPIYKAAMGLVSLAGWQLTAWASSSLPASRWAGLTTQALHVALAGSRSLIQAEDI